MSGFLEYLEHLISIRGDGVGGAAAKSDESSKEETIGRVAAPGRYLEAVVLRGDDEGFQTQGRPPQLLSERVQLPLLQLAAALQPLNLGSGRGRRGSVTPL